MEPGQEWVGQGGKLAVEGEPGQRREIGDRRRVRVDDLSPEVGAPQQLPPPGRVGLTRSLEEVDKPTRLGPSLRPRPFQYEAPAVEVTEDLAFLWREEGRNPQGHPAGALGELPGGVDQRPGPLGLDLAE